MQRPLPFSYFGVLSLVVGGLVACGAVNPAEEAGEAEPVTTVESAYATMVNLTYTILPGAVRTDLYVECPAGTVLTNGGYAVTGAVKVFRQHSWYNKWIVSAQNQNTTPQVINVKASCLARTASAFLARSPFISIGPAQDGCASVTCPGTTIPVGGGFAASSASVEIFRSFPSPSPPISWHVCAHNYSLSQTATLEARIQCLGGITATPEVFGQGPVPPQSGKVTLYARCATAGAELVGGGFFGANPYTKIMATSQYYDKWTSTFQTSDTTGFFSRSLCLRF